MSAAEKVLSVRRLRVALLAILFCTIWSSAFIGTKIGLEASPPLVLAAMRFLLAGVVMLIAAKLMGHSWALPPRDLFIVFGMGVLNNALYLGLTFTALKTVSAGLVSVLASTNPLLTTFAAALWLGERPRPVHFVGLALGILGTILVLRHRLGAGLDGGAGILLALAGIAALVGGTILFKMVKTQHSLFVINAYQLLAGGLILTPLALAQGLVSPPQLNATLLAAVAYLAVIVSIGGTLIWLYLLREGSARAVSAYHFLNPVIGLVLSALILKEPLLPPDLAGLLPIMIGIVLVSRPAMVVPGVLATHKPKDPAWIAGKP